MGLFIVVPLVALFKVMWFGSLHNIREYFPLCMIGSVAWIISNVSSAFVKPWLDMRNINFNLYDMKHLFTNLKHMYMTNADADTDKKRYIMLTGRPDSQGSTDKPNNNTDTSASVEPHNSLSDTEAFTKQEREIRGSAFRALNAVYAKIRNLEILNRAFNSHITHSYVKVDDSSNPPRFKTNGLNSEDIGNLQDSIANPALTYKKFEKELDDELSYLHKVKNSRMPLDKNPSQVIDESISKVMKGWKGYIDMPRFNSLEELERFKKNQEERFKS